MADIKKVNVGGLDYNVKDDTARTNASTALTELAYQETGNTASQAYAIIGTPINWKGTLYYTKTAVAKNATWAVGTNLTLATNLGKLTSNIKTYVNGSGQLVFRDLTGADTVLPFSGTNTTGNFTLNVGQSKTVTIGSSPKCLYMYFDSTFQGSPMGCSWIFDKTFSASNIYSLTVFSVSSTGYYDVFVSGTSHPRLAITLTLTSSGFTVLNQAISGTFYYIAS